MPEDDLVLANRNLQVRQRCFTQRALTDLNIRPGLRVDADQAIGWRQPHRKRLTGFDRHRLLTTVAECRIHQFELMRARRESKGAVSGRAQHLTTLEDA